MLPVSSVIFTGGVIACPNVIGVIIADSLIKVTVITWSIPIQLPVFYVVPFALTFYVFLPFAFERLVERARVEFVGVLERVEERAPRAVLTERFFFGEEAFFFNSATIAFNLSLAGVAVGVGVPSTGGGVSTSSLILSQQ